MTQCSSRNWIPSTRSEQLAAAKSASDQHGENCIVLPRSESLSAAGSSHLPCSAVSQFPARRRLIVVGAYSFCSR